MRSLQNPIAPGPTDQEPTPLSAWIVDYARAWGGYRDTTDSAKEIESFRSDPAFNWVEYIPPPSGYFTFNQFFARHVKPGMRPIAGLADDSIVVSPADCIFVGAWRISEQSEISVNDNELDIKGIQWSIIVLVFERSSNVQLIGRPDVHFSQGSWVGTAFPYAIERT